MGAFPKEHLPWLSSFADQAQLRYEPDADERWLRVWEPFLTFEPPFEFSHSLSSVGSIGSVNLARGVIAALPGEAPAMQATQPPCFAWIAFVQDTRAISRLGPPIAVSSDRRSPFAKVLPASRAIATGDRGFDQAFQTIANEESLVAARLTSPVRQLLLGWNAPMHLEIRSEGYALCFPWLPADPTRLRWLLEAIALLGRKLNG
jgi:hypothetical protein